MVKNAFVAEVTFKAWKIAFAGLFYTMPVLQNRLIATKDLLSLEEMFLL